MRKEELAYTDLNLEGEMRVKEDGLVMGKSCDCLGGHNAEMRKRVSEGMGIRRYLGLSDTT